MTTGIDSETKPVAIGPGEFDPNNAWSERRPISRVLGALGGSKLGLILGMLPGGMANSFPLALGGSVAGGLTGGYLGAKHAPNVFDRLTGNYSKKMKKHSSASVTATELYLTSIGKL